MESNWCIKPALGGMENKFLLLVLPQKSLCHETGRRGHERRVNAFHQIGLAHGQEHVITSSLPVVDMSEARANIDCAYADGITPGHLRRRDDNHTGS